VQDTVIFQGFVPNAELRALYHAADVYVSMSYSESFGQTLVEAMAAGLCVVAAENVGACGIIHDGQTGFLVRPGQVADLVNALRGVCDDPIVRATIGRNAQRVAKECFDWPVIATQYMALYKSLA
jgi:glycosyltransferase involved in cell wall biosynthesis